MSRSFVRRIILQVLPSATRATAGFALSAACLAGLLMTPRAASAQGLYASPTSTPVSITTGATPRAVAAADFARSGFQGLAVVTSGDNSLNVYRGTGNGTFAAGAQSQTCAAPTSVLAADVNNDGYPDLLVACASSNTVDLYLNKAAGGPGTFPLYPSYTFSVTNPVAMVTGDFLGNGYASVAIASGSGGITVVVNTNGNSGVASTIAVSGTLTGITTGDFNHDGHLDLAVSDGAGNQVRVVFGNGAGNFTGLTSYSTGSGTKPSGIATDDFNHDGNLDLAVTNAGTGTVGILLGSAAGTFGAATTKSVGLTPVALSITDVNSDGNPDVIAYDAVTSATGSQNAYVVLLGNGNGTLQAAQTSSLAGLPGSQAAVFDFDRDGKPDLAVAQQAQNTVLLLHNNTLPTQLDSGRSFAAYSPQSAGNGNMADSVAAGDFNLDGKLDVAVTYLQDNVVRVLQNNGSGGF
ncbi:MAG: VCBS repeat-containing protein, partial [Acidobacteriaceae bacterium]